MTKSLNKFKWHIKLVMNCLIETLVGLQKCNWFKIASKSHHVLRLPDVLGQVLVDGFPDDTEKSGESGATDSPFLFRIRIVAVTHLEIIRTQVWVKVEVPQVVMHWTGRTDMVCNQEVIHNPALWRLYLNLVELHKEQPLGYECYCPQTFAIHSHAAWIELWTKWETKLSDGWLMPSQIII